MANDTSGSAVIPPLTADEWEAKSWEHLKAAKMLQNRRF
jgi:hypothetical protein